jgi:hypothetical protein
MANTTTTPTATRGGTNPIPNPKKVLVHQRDIHQGMHFPWKLHELLEETNKGHSSVVSWLPGGKAFKVHKKEDFCNELMPAFFSSSKYKTFQRSLNLWGFKSVSRGPDKGACYHQFFVRGKADLCKNMIRVKIKGRGIAGVPPSGEPETATNVPQESSLATKVSQLPAAAAPSSQFFTKPVSPSMPAISDFIPSKLNSHGSSTNETLGNPVAALVPQRRLAAPMTNPLSLAGMYNSNTLSFMFGANTGYPSSSFGMQYNSSLGMIPSRNRLLSAAINTATAAALDAIHQEEDAILRQAHVRASKCTYKLFHL